MSDENTNETPATEGVTGSIADPEPAADSANDQGTDQGTEQVKGTIADTEDAQVSGKEGAQGQVAEKPSKPEAYTLEVDEKTFPMPAENLASFTDACRKAGLTKEQATAVLEWHKEQYAASQAYAKQEQEATVSSWTKAIMADPEYGGAHYKTTIADARKALNAFDPDGSLRKVLKQTGGEYHPDVIKAVARVGRAMGEHAFVGGNGEGGARRPSLEDRMYPNMNY